MGFVDNLNAQQMMSPIGPSNGVMPFSAVGAGGSGMDLASMLGQIEPFINRMRNRDLSDLRDRQIIESQAPGIRDPRTRNMLDPNGIQQGQPNVVFDPGMTEYQKAGLGIENQKLGLEKQKLASSNKIGDEKLALQEGALKLNQLKNQQIYETKIADMERKANEADAKLELAGQQMRGRENNAMMQDQFHRAQIDAQNARHALDLAQREAAAEETRRLHDAQIKDMQDKLDAASNTETKTVVNPDGTTKTVTVKKGSDTMIRVIAPDGQHGQWPASEPLPKGYTKIQ